LRILYFSFFVVIIDQLSKFFVKGLRIPFLGISIKGMNYGDSLSIVDNFFKITFIENPGMAFGIEVGDKLIRSIFTIIASILVIYLIYKNRNESIYMRLSLAFILGGAIGNLIDRVFYGVIYGYAPIFYGKVVDFFHIIVPDFKLFGKTFYSWPIFNVADISVTIGFIMIVLGYKKVFHKKGEDVIVFPPAEKNINPVEDVNPANNNNPEN
jgi:signal peptidase II